MVLLLDLVQREGSKGESPPFVRSCRCSPLTVPQDFSARLLNGWRQPAGDNHRVSRGRHDLVNALDVWHAVKIARGISCARMHDIDHWRGLVSIAKHVS